MPHAQDEAGNVWETDAQGNAVRLVSQAGGMPADPAFPYQGPQAAADVTQSQASAARANSQTATEDATRPFVVRKAAAEASEAELKAQKAQGSSPEKMLAEAAKTDNLLSTIANARALVRKGGTGWGSLFARLPDNDARDLSGYLDTIRANLTFDRLQQMREESPTGGAVGNASDADMKLLGSTVASLDQGQSQDKVLDSLDRIEQRYKRFRAFNYGVNPDTPEGQKALGAAFGPAATGGQDGGQGGSGGEQYKLGIAEQFATDRDKQFAAVVQAAFNHGVGADEINALSKAYGYPLYNQAELAEGLRARGTGREVNFNPPESGYNDPSIYDRAIQNLGESPVGSYFGQAANALTLGGMDELAGLARGDTLGEVFSGTGRGVTEANLQKQLSADANPTAALLGNISGGVIGALGTGALTGGVGAAAALAPRALLGDAMFGGMYGAGESNENRLGGAAMGAIAGAGGGALGRGVVNKVGQAVGGVGGPGKYLYDQGIIQTPGQIGESSGGTIGQMLKRREDRLAGFSGIGDAIASKQRRGLEQFNQAAFRDVAGETPPAIAEEGVQYLENAVVPNAYSAALDGKTFVPDQQFVEGLDAARRMAAELPAMGEQAQYAMRRSIDPFVTEADEIPGRNMQKMTQELQRRAARMDQSADADGPDAALVLRDVLGTIGDMAERQSPGTGEAFRAANRTYGKTQTIKDAVARAINTEGVFTPAQLGYAARASGKKFGGNQASTDRQFYELQRAGQQVLPSKVPDSGTAGRQAAGDGITGAIKAAARNLRLPLYSDPALLALNTIAYARPEALQTVGDLIRSKAYLGGLPAVPALSYASQ